MDEKLISIIVPIYNVEEYLKKCVNTILKQTYQNIEIILVDDGSTDSSSLIADLLKEKDNRITVIHKENGGLSDARNTGIKHAKGEFVCFIDSDDFVELNYIEELYKTISENNADIAICGYRSVFESGKIKEERTSNKVLTNKEALQQLFTKAQNIETVTWNKIYKLKLFLENGIEFPKGKLHEDNFTTYRLFYFSNRIAYTDKILYNYCQRKNSIVGTYNSKRLVILEVIDEIKQFFQIHKVDLPEEIEMYELIIKLGVINTLISARKTDEPIFKSIVTEIKKKKENYLKNKYLRKKQKISITILDINVYIYIFLRKLYRR